MQYRIDPVGYRFRTLGRRELLGTLLGHSKTSPIKLFQVGWGHAFLQHAIEDTGSYPFYSDHF